MHEYAIVENVVQGVNTQLREQGISQVAEVHFRRGSAFSEESLLQAFEMLSAGTPLEGAKLRIDTVNLEFNCQCGHQQVITSDDLEGHMFVCPRCGFVREVDESHDLELLNVVPVPAST